MCDCAAKTTEQNIFIRGTKARASDLSSEGLVKEKSENTKVLTVLRLCFGMLSLLFFLCASRPDQAKSYHDAWRLVAHNQCTSSIRNGYTLAGISMWQGNFLARHVMRLLRSVFFLGTTKLRWQRASYSKTLLGWE